MTVAAVRSTVASRPHRRSTLIQEHGNKFDLSRISLARSSPHAITIRHADKRGVGAQSCSTDPKSMRLERHQTACRSYQKRLGGHLLADDVAPSVRRARVRDAAGTIGTEHRHNSPRHVDGSPGDPHRSPARLRIIDESTIRTASYPAQCRDDLESSPDICHVPLSLPLKKVPARPSQRPPAALDPSHAYVPGHRSAGNESRLQDRPRDN